MTKEKKSCQFRIFYVGVKIEIMRRRYSRINSFLSRPTFERLKPNLKLVLTEPNLVQTKNPRTRTGRNTVPWNLTKQKVIGNRTWKFSKLVKFGPIVILVHGSLISLPGFIQIRLLATMSHQKKKQKFKN